MIEVGEYVKTNDGHIGKLIRIERDDIDISLKWYVFYDGKNERYINKPYIVKHSHNIMDLIEDTDILQIEINEEWVLKENTIRFIIVGQTHTIEEIKEALENGIYKIKTILTHEQFTQNAYKVEE